jgi:uncharacterized delta-60 repeat protein
MKISFSGSLSQGFSSPRVCLQGALLSLFLTVVCVMQTLAQSGRLDPTFQGQLFFDRAGVVQALQLPDGKLVTLSFLNYAGNKIISPSSSNLITRFNQDGTVDNTFSISSNGFLNRIALAPNSGIYLIGFFQSVQGINRTNIARLNPDGTVDPTFSAGFASADRIESITVQPDGKILVGGNFTTVSGIARNNLVRLNPDGSVDTSFTPGTGANSTVWAFAVQSDGRIYVTGSFNTYDGNPRPGLARLNANGTLDSSFNVGSGPNTVSRNTFMEPLANGGLIYAGGFDTFAGTSRRGIVRLTSAGALDTSFGTPFPTTTPFLLDMKLQPSGKILLAGTFSAVSGQPAGNYVRLNSDGSRDTGFTVAGADTQCQTILTDVQGNIILGGSFNAIGGTTRRKLARFNDAGTLDPAYNPNLRATGISVTALAVQPDDKVLVSGQFTAVGEVNRPGLARLNADGTLDTTFDPGAGPNGLVRSFAVQPDGKILIGGEFDFVGSSARSKIARLNADGSLDASFVVGTGLTGAGLLTPITVYSLAIQSDGKVLLGGAFTAYNNIPARCLARLNTDGTFDSTFNIGTGAGTGDVSIIYGVTTDNQGRVLATGGFSGFNGQTTTGLVRLSATGTLDTAFNANILSRLVGSGESIKLGQDQKIILAGSMILDGVSSQAILKLNSDGTVDPSFINAVPSGVGFQTAILPNGKVMVLGNFTTARGITRNRLALFNTDGTLDQTFTPGASISGNVLSGNILAGQSTGKAILGGTFGAFNGTPVNQIARIRTQNNASTPGQFRPTNGFVYLRNSNDTGFANTEFFYGQAGDIPVAGDWNGDGIDTVGIYRNGTFFLRNSNNTGFADLAVPFGGPGDLPIVGDWDGDGIDTIGIVRGNTVFLRNSNTTGFADIQFAYGNATDIFIVGDWNGDGIDTIGAFRPTNGFVYLRNSNTTGVADIEFFYGTAGDKPVAGDWNADGIDTIGIVRGNQWLLRNSNSTGFADFGFFYGTADDTPIVGDWDGN